MNDLYTIDKLPPNAPIYLFGASRGGEILFKILTETANAQVEGFIDNYRSGDLLGKKILTLDAFLTHKPENAVIVIASQYFAEINIQLRRKNVSDIWNGYPLIQTHLAARARRKSLLLMGGLAALIIVGWMLLR